MFSDTIRRMPHPREVARMTTDELRASFLVEDLFAPGEVRGVFTDLDRLVAGAAVPLAEPLALPKHPETGRAFFLERRELGAINLGGPGTVTADGKSYEVGKHSAIYVGMGVREVTFASASTSDPAKFYFLSCPAHATHPTAVMDKSAAAPVALGSLASANQRTIYKFIHEGGLKSCQLVMGFTEFAEGSVWNTFPPHTHNRRTEIYLYFDLGERVLAHFMGEPQATKHLWVHDGQAVLSPAWSIHAGCGFGAYRFVWGMAGENQRFDDMDAAPLLALR